MEVLAVLQVLWESDAREARSQQGGQPGRGQEEAQDENDPRWGTRARNWGPGLTLFWLS